MKKIFLVLIGVYYLFQSQAQTETTKTSKLNWTVGVNYGANLMVHNFYQSYYAPYKVASRDIEVGTYYFFNENGV